MEYLNIRTLCSLTLGVFLLESLFSASAVAAETASQGSSWIAPASWFTYVVILVVLIGSVVALFFVRYALRNSSWSIADALSEEVEISVTRKDADGTVTVVYDDSSQPMMITEMRASSSRVIAMMGMIVILLMFLGFGAFALYAFAMTGKMPDSIDKVVDFLLAGLTLFAPYFVNKFAAVFERIKPKKA